MFQRRYVREINRIDNIERKIKFLDEQLGEHSDEITVARKPSLNVFLDRMEAGVEPGGNNSRSQLSDIDRLESLVDEREKELAELLRFQKNLREEYAAQSELLSILDKARSYAYENSDSATAEAQGAVTNGESTQLSLGDVEYGGDSMRFQFLAGVVEREVRKQFERAIFRSTRGNCLMRFYELDDGDLTPQAGVGSKDAFFVFFQTKLIGEKIERIAKSFSANLYQIPDLSDVPAIEDRSKQVLQDKNQQYLVLDKNQQDIVVLLSEVGQYIECWKMVCLREKSIYHTMNHFSSDVAGVLHAEGWVRSAKKQEVISLIDEAHTESAGNGSAQGGTSMAQVSDVPRNKWPSDPPTFFKTNKFTNVFQLIVDTYGTPRYKEANPALLTVITFPFSFGIMFGDIGHGSLLFLFALWMLYNEVWLQREYAGKDEIFDIVFGGRYMIVLMGFFATYCGFMYNDFFAMGLRIWPSHWEVNPVESNNQIGFWPIQDTNQAGHKVYPFGVDPTWHRASNDLVFFNSVKMKMAVCFGVTQMVIGLIQRAQNAVYFNKRAGRSIFRNLDLWFEAVPMLIFMVGLFGYMCFMILIKWSYQWRGWDPADCNVGCRNGTLATTSPECTRTTSAAPCDRINCCDPPALITQLINMALKPGNVPQETELYSGQGNVQGVLILVAVLMVPLMLIPKPYFEIQRLKAHHAVTQHATDEDDEDQENVAEEEEHGSGEIIVHQLIETIEFTLGCISNTASYLRLWALSLAHSQLSSVFLDKTLLMVVTMDGAPGWLATFAAYAVFFAITFAVLMCMDNLECFLHALRLSWVEYQNKFFKGDGIPLEAFSFKRILA